MRVKKAISPVVATALLIVVAVVALVGFQSWYGSFSSSLFSQTQISSQNSWEVGIETVVGDQLYIKTNPNKNLTIKKVLIDGQDCQISGNFSGVQNISLSNCINNISTVSPEVVVITENEVLEKKVYLPEAQIVVASQTLGSSQVYTDTFISVWNTSVTGAGTVSNTNQIELPLEVSGTYNFEVTGNNLIGSPLTITSESQKLLNFTTSGLQEINITGQIQGFRFDGGGDRSKLYEIKAWGPLNLGNNGAYFRGCSDFNFTGTDDLNLAGTTNLSEMFSGNTNFNGNVSNWDTSSVTDMSLMFFFTSVFNQDINNWDVSNVQNMNGMFYNAFDFNQSLNNWDVSSVTDMSQMFRSMAVGWTDFNGNISNWDVSSVTNMNQMFQAGNKFNQNLISWNVNNVITCTNFNASTVWSTSLQPNFTSCTP